MGSFKYSKPARPEDGAHGIPGFQVLFVPSREVVRPGAHDIPRRQDQGPRREAGELGNSHQEVGATLIAGAGARKRTGLPPGPGAAAATATTPFMAQQAGESFPVATPT